MVWSPNQVSNWDIDIDDYYPGDEYVDWVGISLYAQKYFYGTNSEDGELFFRTGKNSDPVIAVKDIVEKYLSYIIEAAIRKNKDGSKSLKVILEINVKYCRM